MKRIHIALAIADAVILIGWSWFSWPGHVTAWGVTVIVAPLYVAFVSLLVRQDADRAWMHEMLEWAEGVEAERPAVDKPKPHPGDLPTAESHALDIAGGLRMPVETGPPTQVTGEWREVNIGGEKRRFLIGP